MRELVRVWVRVRARAQIAAHPLFALVGLAHLHVDNGELLFFQRVRYQRRLQHLVLRAELPVRRPEQRGVSNETWEARRGRRVTGGEANLVCFFESAGAAGITTFEDKKTRGIAEAE